MAQIINSPLKKKKSAYKAKRTTQREAKNPTKKNPQVQTTKNEGTPIEKKIII